jgi:spore protease
MQTMLSSTRTDLALEAHELVGAADSQQPLPGVEKHVTEIEEITITTIKIRDEIGAKTLQKQPGTYITIEVPQLRHQNSDLQHRVSMQFAKAFKQFLDQIEISREAKVLIVGLGNWQVTPDALGPLVVENIWVTRHYFELTPDQVSSGYREVSAVVPGVLGTTGIESGDIITGIIEQSKPDFVIAIDALASKSLDRVNTTIQIADTGVHPGSGIGNKRKAITKDNLGVPVIAIGVPTVVYASTIVNNAIEYLQQHLQAQLESSQQLFGILEHISTDERLELVREVLHPLGHDLLVTPKEIDQFIEDIANIIANGLNCALHDAIHEDNVSAYTH